VLGKAMSRHAATDDLHRVDIGVDVILSQQALNLGPGFGLALGVWIGRDESRHGDMERSRYFARRVPALMMR